MARMDSAGEVNANLFGKYELLRRLATGSTSEIWLARQRGIGGFAKNLVIKRMLPGLVADSVSVRRFLNEALIASRLNHPAIAQVYEFGEADNTYYIAMEFIHGEDLGQLEITGWNRSQWIARPLALRLVANVCEGLYYAHSLADDVGRALRIVHRDICPQNILVTFSGAVKLVDFGIAKTVDPVVVTKTGEIKGNLAYMAPEQAAGKPLDHRADIFALGLVLYELLTGVRPLKRDSGPATLKAAIKCDIPPPSEIADVPVDLDPIVMGALAKSVGDRYRDARQFQIALEETLVVQRWVASSVQISELMETLFAEKLAEEKRIATSVLTGSSGVKIQAAWPVDAQKTGAMAVTESSGQSQRPAEDVPLVAWLHLSDIHFGYREPGSRWDQKLVIDALRRDIFTLAQRKNPLPSPDMILVTGDIAFSGLAPQYAEAKKWLLGVAEGIGLDLSHVFTVPGNHDVERAVGERRPVVGWLAEALRESTLDIDAVLENEEGRDHLAQRFSNYLDFAASCAVKRDSAKVSWCNPLVASNVLRIRLVGFNTAILAADSNDRGKLRLGQRAIGEAFLEPPVSDGELVLVMSHHPFRDGWLADERDAVGWIRKYAHLHLSGHVHEGRSEVFRDGSGHSLVSIVAGAVHDRDKVTEPSGYGYNLSAVFRGRDGLLKLKIWPRLWSARNKGFGVDVHNVNDGQESAEYPLFYLK
jgi:serine/threonine protein kinase/3',5'-cyclic AMP phosphodiesterase CpdA